jgi:hypothetical protein
MTGHAVLPDVDGPERVTRLAPMAARAAVFAGGEIPVLEVGAAAGSLTLSRVRLEELLRAALAPDDDAPSWVWVDGDSELAVHAGRTRVALAPGLLVVGVRVECDQTGPAEVTIPFALGSDELAAGLVMSAPRRPDGPAAVVDRWGAVIVAATYRAVLDVVTATAQAAGVDRDGRPLIPGAATTDGKTLAIVPQARHAIDRRRLA